MKTYHEPWVKKCSHLQSNKDLYEQFHDVCISTINSSTATLDEISQTAPSMVCWTTNLDIRMAWRRVFEQISILFTTSKWLHPCLSALWRTYLPAFIRHGHVGRSSGMMICGAIGYTFRSIIIHTGGIFKAWLLIISTLYIHALYCVKIFTRFILC